MQIHFLNLEEKKNIDMAQNSTQITEIALLKAEKKQLVTEN